jgi:hypothetical protein
MKKVLILALLAFGCKAGTVEQTTPTPPPPVVEEAANPYEGTYTFLRSLVDLTPEEFASVCGEVGGSLDTSGPYTSCTAGGAGFAIKVVEGLVLGSSMLIPAGDAQLVADALVSEIGNPTAFEVSAAVWELEGFFLVFAPVTETAFIVVLEREGGLS